MEAAKFGAEQSNLGATISQATESAPSHGHSPDALMMLLLRR